MPSLKMKSKSATGCLKEKNGLHVCPKSCMISKNPLSHARALQNAEAVGAYDRSCEDGSVYDKVYLEDIGRNDAKHDEWSNEEKILQKLPSSLADSATADIMDAILSTCTSNIETIFSSILEPLEFHNNGGNVDLYVPQLDSEESDDSSRNSYRACTVSDSDLSDMIFSGLPIRSNSFYNTDTLFLPDYKCEESSLLCDLTEEYMLLPSLEDASDTVHDHDGRLSEETIIDADNSSLYMAIHQLKPYNQVSHMNTYPDPDYECFDPQIFIRNLPDQLDSGFGLLAPSLPIEEQTTKRITLVLDLDETLVHSTLEQCDNADFTFTVFFNSKEHIVYVKQRPHLQTFLERVAKMFEIVVFTASQSIYANQLLDILDPDGKLISRREFRESCILSEGSYVKDLTILGVDLSKVAIVDNSPQVFRLQVNNGIPIESWFDDPSDRELILLLPFLETLVFADDVRPIIARKFGNWE